MLLLTGAFEPIDQAKADQAGCDGVQVNFYDYLPDLEFFGAHVLPLMKQAALRAG